MAYSRYAYRGMFGQNKSLNAYCQKTVQVQTLGVKGIYMLSKFFYSPTDAQVNSLKKQFKKFTLKLILKHLRHVSLQSRHHQGAHYSCLLKLQLLK